MQTLGEGILLTLMFELVIKLSDYPSVTVRDDRWQGPSWSKFT